MKIEERGDFFSFIRKIFPVDELKKNQEKFDILSKYTIFRSLLIGAASMIFQKSLNLHKKNSKKTFFAHNVIYKKNRKLLGYLPVNLQVLPGNNLVIYE